MNATEKTIRQHFSPPARERGSLIIVAMILCAIIAISLTSYLQLGRTSMNISNGAFYVNAAMNLAENGLEQATYAVNKLVADSTYSWAAHGWTITGAGSDDAYQKWTGYSLDQNTTGEVRVYVYNYKSNAPEAVARSIVTLGGTNGKTVEKWVYVKLRKSSKFSNGLVAKNSIVFAGTTASVDSYNSEPTTGTIQQYSSTTKHDNGSVGSISVAVDSVLVKNADIWGYVSTGGANPVVGSQGTVGPFGTATGTVDTSHVSTDFTASLDPKTMPSGGSAMANITQADLPMTLGTSNTTATYQVASISSSGNSSNILTINGNVTLLVSGDLSLTGQSSIYVPTGSQLTLYVQGNVDLTGGGVANGTLGNNTTSETTSSIGQPKNFTIYGCGNSTQSIKVAGNGVLSGVIYAPNANVTIQGNTDVCGSVVGGNISVSGSSKFHYDESLASLDGGDPFRISKWQELTSASDRAGTSHTPTYSSALTF